MPTGVSGNWNLAALQVPGVFIDIIPPSPNLNGVPTNEVGVVGVGSWGPVGSVIGVNQTTDCATKVGVPQLRAHDIASHIWAACQVGGYAIFDCVRVTDGTDTAATASIQSGALTVTAKYTGSLGNNIAVSFSAGTQANSYNASVQFPGVSPELFNNVGLGIGSIATVAGTTFTSVPTVASITAPPAVPGAQQAVIQPTLSVYAATVTAGGTSGFAINDLLYLSNGVILKVATQASGVIQTVTVQNSGSLTGGSTPTNPVSMVSTSGAGVGTPTFTLSWGLGAPNILVPGSGYATAPTITLSGGGGTGGSYTASLSAWLNLANAINNGNAYRAASNYVVASAGTSTSAPTTGVATTLSGGTDGALGVTDTTLIGTDTLPRKGMYSLRSSGVDTFTLVDLSTSTLWPTIDAFAQSENCLAVHATASGTSITATTAARTAAGLDDFYSWIVVGDWPTFYDSYNAISRLVCPSAFAIGLAGNLSPEQSPLNKPLRGITQTQMSQTGATYGNSDLTNVEQGGVDLIVGPPTTPGGAFYTFISGRNAWSNSGGNGVEFTRMTNFIARSLQSTAAGSIVGKMQSIQPNDQTRSNAKALLDGFFAQLADPESGSNGLGMIDTWSVVCDLTNNPPALQARGYLYAYCAVRYLNTVRYFVVQLAGGGNVTVTSQSTVPSAAQYV